MSGSEEDKSDIASGVFHRKENTDSRFFSAWNKTLLGKSLNGIALSPHAKEGLTLTLSVITCLDYFVYQTD